MSGWEKDGEKRFSVTTERRPIGTGSFPGSFGAHEVTGKLIVAQDRVRSVFEPIMEGGKGCT